MKKFIQNFVGFAGVAAGAYYTLEAFKNTKAEDVFPQKETVVIEAVPEAPEDFQPALIQDNGVSEWDMPFMIAGERAPHFITVPYNEELIQKVLSKCFIEENGGYDETGNFSSNPKLRQEAAKAIYMLIANAFFEEGVLIGKTRQELPTHTVLSRLQEADDSDKDRCKYLSASDVVTENKQFSWLNSGKIPEISKAGKAGIEKLNISVENTYYAISIFRNKTCTFYYNEGASSPAGKSFFNNLKKSGKYITVRQVPNIYQLNGVLYADQEGMSPHQALCPVEYIPVGGIISAEEIAEKFQ